MRKFLFFIIVVIGITKVSAQLDSDWFVTTWDTRLGNNDNTIVFNALGSNYTIQYQNITGGAWTTFSNNMNTDLNSPTTVTFPSAGQYRVRMFGGSGATKFRSFNLSIQAVIGNNIEILKVEQWGTTAWEIQAPNFSGANNLDVTAQDIPNFSNVTNMTGMFSGCLNLVGNNTFNNWNTSNVTSMYNTFNNAKKFNINISNWDTSKVTTMYGMFMEASIFNQNISSWSTTNVTNMSSMFFNAFAFNQPIGSWNVSNALYMSRMFTGAQSFNQSLSNWNVSKVVTMDWMFYGAINFNQPINSWNVGSVVNMEAMFFAARDFNQDLSSWNISNTKNLYTIFQYSNISAYNYSKILNSWAMQNFSITIPSNGILNDTDLRRCGVSAQTISTLQSKGLAISSQEKCVDNGVIYLEKNNSNINKTLVGVKLNNAFEFLADYNTLNSSAGGPLSYGILRRSINDGILVKSYSNHFGINSSLNNYQLRNTQFTGSANIQVLPSSTIINGQTHGIAKIVYNPTTGNFYEGTAAGWERIDN